MNNSAKLVKIAKKHAKLIKTHEGEELVEAITIAEPELEPESVEAVVEIIEALEEEAIKEPPTDGGEPPAPDPTENQGETMDMPEDGVCPEGWEPSEDALSCVKIVETTPDPIENPEVLPIGEDGTCPDGYRPTEDGTACIEAELTPEAENILTSLYHNSNFLKSSRKVQKKTIQAAYKRAHLTPCGCGYAKGHKPKPKTYKLNTSNKQLKHTFDWSIPMELNKETFEEMMLVKGVAMTSGEAKRGENMTQENVIYGAGAMSAAAMFGLAVCDIDHFEAQLPSEYVEKYGSAINDPYPVAIILDAAAEKYTDETTGEERVAVEFIASVTNPLVYSMIKKGKFKGCSVVDYYRKENCDACGESKCSCSIEGSHFLVNTFVLEGVPNAHGTWVAPVTGADLGKIISIPDENTLHNLKHKMAHNAQLKAKHSYVKMAVRNHMHTILEEYLDGDGKFSEGESGIVKFLIDEKGIGEAKAKDMANYLTKHPDALSQEQYEFMSAEDLVQWFTHIVDKNTKKMRSHLNKIIKVIAESRHSDMLGKETVNYRPSDGNSACEGCRWFTPNMDFETGEFLPTGYCSLVVGDIEADHVCDRHEVIQPAGSGETPDPAENTIPMPEEGGCPEGFSPSEDGTECIGPVDKEPETAASTLSHSTIKKYTKTGKHSQMQIEKHPAKTRAQQKRLNTAKTIEHLKKQPVFFAQNGAKLQGEIQDTIRKLSEKKTR